MEDTLFLLLGLLLAVLILQVMQGTVFSKKKETARKKGGVFLGQAMTIGDREIQEDCLGVKRSRQGLLLCLADGSGQSYGGRLASRIAVQCLLEEFAQSLSLENPPYFFRRAFQVANREIKKMLEEERRGTASLAAVLIKGNALFYAVVGNVSVRVLRNGELVPVSTGHTVFALAQEKFLKGHISRQDALALLEEQRLYNYLGQEEFREIEIFDAPILLSPGDLVVLMSDGLYDLLSYAEMEKILLAKGDCQEKAVQLVEAVNQHPKKKKDNASVLLFEVRKGGLPL